MNWFKRLFAPLAAFLAIASPAAARAPQQQARPALWEVKHADSTIYLFGTIHLLPTGYHWRTPKFDKALSSSNELVVETIVDLQHPDEILNAKRELGYSAGLPPIEDRVPPAKRTRLRAMIAKTGVPEPTIFVGTGFCWSKSDLPHCAPPPAASPSSCTARP